MIPFSARQRERDLLETGTFTFEKNALEKLEDAVCAYHGCSFTVAFSTPEAALYAVTHTAGITAGDEIVAGALAPLYHYTTAAGAGAKMRYPDIGLDGNLYPKSLQNALSPQTKAVLLPSFEGISAGTPPLPESVLLLQDLSLSLSPAAFTGIALWSLVSMMPEGVEKSGFVLTDDAEAARQLKLFRQQGYKRGVLWNYDLVQQGADCALSDLAASVALKQTQKLNEACSLRREFAQKLDASLKTNNLFDVIKRAADDILNSYPVLLTPPLYCPKEDIFGSILQKGVEAAVCYKPVYKTTAYKNDSVRLEVTESFYKALLQLPCHHRLTSPEVDTVAAALLESVDAYAYRGCRF